jgi:TonB family protein
VGLACALVAGRAAAQGNSCTPDTATVVKRLVVGLSADHELDSASRRLTTTVAAQIAAFVEAPTRLTMDKLRGPGEWKDGTETYTSEGLLSIGQIGLDLAPDGHVHRVALDPGTGSPEVDRAILGAVAAADSGGVFPAAGAAPGAAAPGNAARHVRLWVLTAATPAATWAAPLFMVAGRIPANATPAVVRSQPQPSYPQALLARGIEGDAYLAFEIDAQGRVPESSIQVLSADDPAFVEPAKQSIRQASFVAGTEGGCAVATRMRQRVRFRPPTTATLGASSPSPSEASPAGDGISREDALAEQTGWLAANLTRVGRTKVLIEVEANIGGTDVATARARVPRPKLDKCVLTVEEVFERDDVDDITGGARVRQIVPLRHADPGSSRFSSRNRMARASAS